MKTYHEYMSELFKGNPTLEERALGITLAKVLDSTGYEHSDNVIEVYIAYYRTVKEWLGSPVTKTLTPEEVAGVENRRTP